MGDPRTRLGLGNVTFRMTRAVVQRMLSAHSLLCSLRHGLSRTRGASAASGANVRMRAAAPSQALVGGPIEIPCMSERTACLGV